MAEVHFVDGLQLDHTSFGQTKAGIWIPKNYTGSHGTTGFYLPFDDGSALGDDESANTNDWTPDGFVATDVVDDTPTNNFPTLNPLANNQSATLSEGNLKLTTPTSGYGMRLSSLKLPTSGKWYWEAYLQAVNTVGPILGVSSYDTQATQFFVDGNIVGLGYYGASGVLYGNQDTSGSSYGATYAAGDIIGVAVNLDDNQVSFYKNNASQGADSFDASGLFATFGDYSNSNSCTWVVNFGQDSSFANNKTSGSAEAADANGVGDFYYTPPSGFLALCSADLPSPVVDPAENEEPQDHFNIVLWTGDGSQTRSLTGVGFKPSWTWMKLRDSTIQDHQFYDAVRGAGGGKALASNTTAVEGTVNSVNDSDYGYLSSFDSDGFSVNDGAISTVGGYVNYSGRNYVAWNWLAGGESPTKTYRVVVVNDGGNNKYRFRNSANNATFAASAVTLELQEGGTYTFEVSDSTVSSHPFVIGTSANSSEYSTGVTYVLDGVTKTYSEYTSGFSSATSRQLIITVAASAPTLYYWCSVHSGMGGQINTNSTFGSTNFDGTILATVCENATTGISIIGWTGNQVDNTVIPHGLGANADVVITKRRSASSDWLVLHSAVATNTSNVLRLNSNAGTTNGSSTLSQGCPDEFTSVGFKVVRGTGSTMTNVNGSGSTYIAYAFKSSDGFSQFGSYIGNGSSDGPYVFTGFRVTWLMMKSTSTGDWYIWDSVRDTDNGVRLYLRARLQNVEGGTSSGQQYFDFLSNGFKIIADSSAFSEGNSSGQEYVYFAFAEQPFKFANAR